MESRSCKDSCVVAMITTRHPADLSNCDARESSRKGGEAWGNTGSESRYSCADRPSVNGTHSLPSPTEVSKSSKGCARTSNAKNCIVTHNPVTLLAHYVHVATLLITTREFAVEPM